MPSPVLRGRALSRVALQTIVVDTSAAPPVVVTRVYAEREGVFTVGDTFVVVVEFSAEARSVCSALK